LRLMDCKGLSVLRLSLIDFRPSSVNEVALEASQQIDYTKITNPSSVKVKNFKELSFFRLWPR